MKVYVYYNLHRRCLSVKATQGEHANLVIAHANAVQLGDVRFKVSEAGRQRVLREKAKNVHAGLVGELQGIDAIQWLKEVPKSEMPDMGKIRALLSRVSTRRSLRGEARAATYNPYRFDSFVDRDSLTPVLKSKCVDVVDKEIVYAHG
jgi:hypothetical protein